MSKVTGKFTWPVARKDGSALALSDIDHGELTRNGVALQNLVPNAADATFTDLTPITGSDDYNVRTVTKDGLISDPSNNAIVTVVGANPAAAISDLQATFVA